MLRRHSADLHNTWWATHSSHTWLIPVADDFQLEASGPCYSAALVVFFLLCSCNVPLSWSKTAGGDTVTWVGFKLLLPSYQLVISARRAEWMQRWLRDVASAEYIQMSKFEEGLGRMIYVAEPSSSRGLASDLSTNTSRSILKAQFVEFLLMSRSY